MKTTDLPVSQSATGVPDRGTGHRTLNFRATLEDGDPKRERPLTTYHPTIEAARAWAKLVLPGALDGAAVAVFQTLEQQVELIPKNKPEK
jgi:hypothetical protein